MESMKVILSIVERGQGAAMQRLYRKRQVPIHLQCAGKGTATSEIMDILGLGSSEKDVVISFAAASAARKLLQFAKEHLEEIRSCSMTWITSFGAVRAEQALWSPFPCRG